MTSLDDFSVEKVKDGGLIGNRVVFVKGLKKKEFTFKELYQTLKSLKSKQNELSIKTALVKVLGSDATSKKGMLESFTDTSGDEMAPIIGKEEAKLCREIASCIRDHKYKDNYVLKDLGIDFIKVVVFRNANQFLSLEKTLPSDILSYDQYTNVKKSWLKLCDSIYHQTRYNKKLSSQEKDEIFKSIRITCQKIMTAFSQTNKADYRPVEKILSDDFLYFLTGTDKTIN